MELYSAYIATDRWLSTGSTLHIPYGIFALYIGDRILISTAVAKRGGVGHHLEYVARTPSKLVILQKVCYNST